MRTRNQSKQHRSKSPSSSRQDTVAASAQPPLPTHSIENPATSGSTPRKLLKHQCSTEQGGGSSIKSSSPIPQCADCISSTYMSLSGPEGAQKLNLDSTPSNTTLAAQDCETDLRGKTKVTREHEVASGEETDDFDWEDGGIPVLNSGSTLTDSKGLTIEFHTPPQSVRKKPVRRFSAEDKEVAELVHKAHLLCLLARGRLIDRACDDSLIQSMLLSILPRRLKISEAGRITASDLAPFVHWLHDNFHVQSRSSEEQPFRSALASALESHEGTPEVIAALSVALFRSLNLNTRFVTVMDVVSLKPQPDQSETLQSVSKGFGIFNNPRLMVAGPSDVLTHAAKSSHPNNNYFHKIPDDKTCKVMESNLPINIQTNDSFKSGQSSNRLLGHNDTSQGYITEKHGGSKRKGDLEFEMQVEMAISATAIKANESISESEVTHSISLAISPVKNMKEAPMSPHDMSFAIGTRKVGPPLFWAEVYCNGENQTGRWIHVDAVNSIIDGELLVEAAAAASKTPLRYVIAFAGFGAKDVTHRYCTKWHKISSKRINAGWWDSVLAPLKLMELRATETIVNLERGHVNVSDELTGTEHMQVDPGYSVRNSLITTNNSMEDMELETRALTEPLPTNQQAYRTHPLYAIEKWLAKYQILHPKGPVLGFVSGHPVYPRSCVQTLMTKQKWLREGLQLKPHELPLKVLKRSLKVHISEDDDHGSQVDNRNIELYGKWQMEPLRLACAVNGIVPKNERGQVDVWSEKCLPPGTCHLRLPRVVHVVKRLGIDFAPAMIGFEFRNGRSYSVHEGIVVCTEFRDAVMEAYAEEEESREAEQKKRDEAQALSRWYQLLSSIVTRQRLNNLYDNDSSSQPSREDHRRNDKPCATIDDRKGKSRESIVSEPKVIQYGGVPSCNKDHEHVFLSEDQDFDEERLVQIKHCRCGFSVEVEEL